MYSTNVTGFAIAEEKKIWNTYLVTLEACEKSSSLTSEREMGFLMY